MVREYDYDGWGRLRRLYLTKDGQKRLFLDVDGYTDSHLMRGYELPEYGVKREYSYNAQNDRITGIKDLAGEQLIVQDAYGYDGVGNRTNRTLTRPNTRIPETQMVGVFAGSVTGGDDHPGQDPGSPGSSPTFVTNTTYEYDKLDRLISFIQENSDGVSFGKEYEYDKSGNMERDRWTGLDEYAVVKMRYKNDADQIESQWRTFQKGDGGWLDYEYDQHGSLTSITGRDNANTFMSHSYEWDARNTLVKATTRGVGGDSESESLYDKDGLRYKHVVTRHSAQNSHSGLDPESSNGHSAPDAEQRSEGDVEEVVSRYFYEDGGRLIAEQVGDTLYTYVHLGAHAVVRFNENANGVIPDSDPESSQGGHFGKNTVIPASEVESPGSSPTSTLLYHRDALGTTLATSFYDADLQQWKINSVDTPLHGRVAGTPSRAAALLSTQERCPSLPPRYCSAQLGSVVHFDNEALPRVSFTASPYGQEASFHHAGTGQTGFEFTGKKRDSATYLDYFHDRYLIPGIPHFLQSDRGPWIYTNVKTLNRYQANYQNYPRFYDYDGKRVSSTTGGFSIRNIFNKIFQMDTGMTTEQATAQASASQTAVAEKVPHVRAVGGAGGKLGVKAGGVEAAVGFSVEVNSQGVSHTKAYVRTTFKDTGPQFSASVNNNELLRGNFKASRSASLTGSRGKLDVDYDNTIFGITVPFKFTYFGLEFYYPQ